MDQTPVMCLLAGSQPATHVCGKGRAFENLNFLSNMTSLAAILPLTNFCFCLTVQIRETLKSMDSSCTGKEIEMSLGGGGVRVGDAFWSPDARRLENKFEDQLLI